jgi:hypothetical protein
MTILDFNLSYLGKRQHQSTCTCAC